MVCNYTVYMHITPSNKRYIGITSKSVNKRWNNGGGYRSNKYFYNAIMKYGWENIKHIIIVNNVSREFALELEKYLILKYNTYKEDFGYNHAVGGPNNKSGYHYNHSEITKKLISSKKKGKNHSESHKRALKEAWKIRHLTGKDIAWNKGLKLKETGMLDNFIKAGTRNAEEMRKPIYKIGLNTGEIIDKFSSITEAARSCEKNYVSSIVEVLKGRRKSAFGYYWRYVNK